MANKAIFLDRDDTLIEDPGYISHPDQVKLLPGAAAALIQLRNMGYLLVVVTNQSGVARGIVSEQTLAQIHQRMQLLLRQQGTTIDRIYYCPFHPDGVIPKYRRESSMRKPGSGMLTAAADEMDIDLQQSWMVGNSFRDVTAGLNAGCRTILISSSIKPPQKTQFDPAPDFKAVNLKEVVNILKMQHRQKPLTHIHETAAEKNYPPVQQTEPDFPDEPFVHPSQSEPDLPPAADSPPVIRPEQPAAPNEINPQTASAAAPSQEDTKQMFEQLLNHLKISHREKMYNEFSAVKFVAGMAQAVVFLCMVVSIWFWIDDTRPMDAVHTMIGYALLFQLMAICFYIMKDTK